MSNLLIEENNFDIDELMSPHSDNEFIPPSIIDDIIQSTFSIFTHVLHEFNSEHKLIKVPIREFISANIANWEYNRPADNSRCPDMAKFISKKTHVDSMFLLAFSNTHRRFEIIDGIHRFTALKLLYDAFINNSSEYGTINPLMFDGVVILNIQFNRSTGELIEVFQSVNKSIPVPDLYIRNIDLDKKEIIEWVCKTWQLEYKDRFSASARPNRPNINRDTFIEFIEYVFDKYRITMDTKDVLLSTLRQLNTYVMHNIPKKISHTIYKKCSDSGCYLFIHDIKTLKSIV